VNEQLGKICEHANKDAFRAIKKGSDVSRQGSGTGKGVRRKCCKQAKRKQCERGRNWYRPGNKQRSVASRQKGSGASRHESGTDV